MLHASESRDGNIHADIAQHAETLRGISVPTHTLRTSMFEAFRSGRIQPKAEDAQGLISEHLRTWADFSNTVIPPTLASRYIKDQALSMADYVNMLHPGTLTLGLWIDDPTVQFNSNEERKARYERFTRKEILDYLEWLREYPEAMSGLMTAQILVGRFINDVQQHMEKHEGYDFLAKHWTGAVNNLSFVGPSLFLTDGEGRFDEAHINRAFDFMQEVNAFNFKIPRTSDGTVLTFACPVQRQLKSMWADNGVLSHAIQCARAARGYETFKQNLGYNVDLVSMIIKIGGFKLYEERYLAHQALRNEIT